MADLKIREDKSQKTDVIITAILMAMILTILISCAKLFSILYEYYEGSKDYEMVKEMVIDEIPEILPELEDTEENIIEEIEVKAPISVDFNRLTEINPDIIGWIYVEAIPEISYPIVKGEDNEYYLHRTYEKKENFAGSIFIDYENTSDFTDCNTIIYGHNMKNGSMFGKLKNFKKKETSDSSRSIWILTPTKDFRYEVFSAYTTPVGSDTYILIKGPGEELLAYAEGMKGKSEVDFGEFVFKKTDKVITLSTCTGNDATRFVLQAVRQD